MLDKHIIQEPSNKHRRADFLGWWLLKIHQGSHLDHQSQPVSQPRWKNLPRDPFFLYKSRNSSERKTMENPWNKNQLVGGFNLQYLKIRQRNILVKLDHFTNFWDETSKNIWSHQPVYHAFWNNVVMSVWWRLCSLVVESSSWSWC